MSRDNRSNVPLSAGTRLTNSTYDQFMKGCTAFSIEYDTRILSPLEKFASTKSEGTLNTIAGGTAGAVSGFVTCPLDVIKTKLQAQGGFRLAAQQASQIAPLPGPPSSSANVVYNGLVGTARVIWREEGLRGMYRGLGPIILGYLPTWAVWFFVYGRAKEVFRTRVGKS